MKKLVFGLLVSLLVVSCGTSKPAVSSSPSVPYTVGLKKLESRFSGTVSKERSQVLKIAERYLGVPYKFGGTTTSGMDCSGFTSVVFLENNYKLPRRSADQATVGNKIAIERVKPGDLLFFRTGGSGINHVGIVHTIGNNGEVKFIHASTSKGVIISSLNEKYWNKAFLHAQEIL